jgi:hypothetical protein
MTTLIRKSQEMMDKICDAYGIDKTRIQRIIIDLGIDYPPIVYVRFLDDGRLLELNWADIEPTIRFADDGE